MKGIRDKIKEWKDAKLLWEQEGNTDAANDAEHVIHGLSVALCFVDNPNIHIDKCIQQVDLYKPLCFGRVYDSLHDCEPCPVFDSCEIKALTEEL